MKNINDIKIKGKRVLLRADLNVPLMDGKVLDDAKIEAHIPTIKALLKKDAKIIIISHLGRPKGKKVKDLSLSPVAERLEKILGKKVEFSTSIWGKKLEDKTKEMESKDILVLENLRYEEGEELNDKDLSERISRLGDIFVQDAFANCHRDHASMIGIPKHLPSYAGLLLESEIKGLNKCLINPKKPFVCVIGGVKISTKIKVVKSLIEKADVLLIGGGMANTFLAAEGYDIGESLIEKDMVDEADEVLRDAHYAGVEVLLPEDVIITKKIAKDAKTKVKDISHVSKTDIIADIGPKTVGKFAEPIRFAGTIFWNGPLGITEFKQFSQDTVAIAKIILETKACTVVGGGDTLAVLEKKSEIDKFTFVSTGGGATMEYIEKDGKLPGIEALK